MSIERLAIAITFFYKESRLGYLKEITKSHNNLAKDSSTFLITNTKKPNEIKKIKDHAFSRNLEILTPTYLGHPYLLTWSHREIFKKCIKEERGYSHFLYTEDDLMITKENIDYWLHGINNLKSINCIPGFVRYEINSNGAKVCTDIVNSIDIRSLPRIHFKDYTMVGFPKPYQGMYLLSEEHAIELLFTEAGSPDTGSWNIREKAAQGLTFWEFPSWANSRHFVAITDEFSINPGALIHHLPNNYALNAKESFGSLEVTKIIKNDSIFISILKMLFKFVKKIYMRSKIFLKIKKFSKVIIQRVKFHLKRHRQ